MAEPITAHVFKVPGGALGGRGAPSPHAHRRRGLQGAIGSPSHGPFRCWATDIY
jgi:hypothetical protein